jgi:hypothetical protein
MRKNLYIFKHLAKSKKLFFANIYHSPCDSYWNSKKYKKEAPYYTHTRRRFGKKLRSSQAKYALTCTCQSQKGISVIISPHYYNDVCYTFSFFFKHCGFNIFLLVRPKAVLPTFVAFSPSKTLRPWGKLAKNLNYILILLRMRHVWH